MRIATRVPDPAAVTLERIAADEASVTLVVRARRARVPCPCCESVATRIHSRYTRRLAVMWTNVKAHGCLSFSRPVCHGRGHGKPGRRLTV